MSLEVKKRFPIDLAGAEALLGGNLFGVWQGDSVSGALRQVSLDILMAYVNTLFQPASKAYVDAKVLDIIDAAPGALDTLNELAAALNDDADFATTVTNLIALKAPIADPVFTGAATAPRFIPTGSTVPANGLYLPAANQLGFAVNSTEILRVTALGLLFGSATSAFPALKRNAAAIDVRLADDSGYAAINTATAAAGTNTKQAATTEFVKSAIDNAGLRPLIVKATTAAFDKSNTTLSAVTGLPVNVEAGKTYRVRAVLHCDQDATGGVKAAIDGSATFLILGSAVITNEANGVVQTGTRLSSQGATISATGAGTQRNIVIDGIIVVSADGTVSPYFAQSTANGTSIVLSRSHFEVIEVAP